MPWASFSKYGVNARCTNGCCRDIDTEKIKIIKLTWYEKPCLSHVNQVKLFRLWAINHDTVKVLKNNMETTVNRSYVNCSFNSSEYEIQKNVNLLCNATGYSPKLKHVLKQETTGSFLFLDFTNQNTQRLKRTLFNLD